MIGRTECSNLAPASLTETFAPRSFFGAPGFDPARLYMECLQWSPKPNFGTTHRQELKSCINISVLLHANVTPFALGQFGSPIVVLA
jgi:hypothetical protein